MELSPRLYHYFVRPKWFTERYIKKKLNYILADYDFKEKSVIDFGCGIGSNCVMFDSKGYIGLDYDKRRINYATRMFHPYKFSTFDGKSLSIPSNSIDYVVVMAVLHHIDKKEILSYIKEFKRVLKSEGKIIIMEPCFFKDSPIRNLSMKFLDKGKYIRTKKDYVELFNKDIWKIEDEKRLNKCFVYNEIFFVVAIK